jgi:hypothetical protein
MSVAGPSRRMRRHRRAGDVGLPATAASPVGRGIAAGAGRGIARTLERIYSSPGPVAGVGPSDGAVRPGRSPAMGIPSARAASASRRSWVTSVISMPPTRRAAARWRASSVRTPIDSASSAACSQVWASSSTTFVRAQSARNSANAASWSVPQRTEHRLWTAAVRHPDGLARRGTFQIGREMSLQLPDADLHVVVMAWT